MPGSVDHGLLVNGLCVLLEQQLAAVLELARDAAGDVLVEALHQSDRKRQAVLLDKWARRHLPTTLGTLVLAVMALERVSARGAARVEQLPRAEGFSPSYWRTVRVPGISRELDRVRVEFRNPAAHGLRVFGREDYRLLVGLLLDTAGLSHWYRSGPRAQDRGLLDLHLMEVVRHR